MSLITAHLHHEPSLAALGIAYREVRTADELHEWTAALIGWGKLLAVKAAVVAGDIGVPVYEREKDCIHARACLEAARRWTECPCRDHQKVAYLTVSRASTLGATANGNTGYWSAWAASHDDPVEVAREVGYAATCASFSARSAARVAATISRSLLVSVLDRIPVPRITANKARPVFLSWTLTD